MHIYPACLISSRKYYIVSFVMSVVWIMILSFAMVTIVGRTGCILGVDSYVMGLVVVAMGTSIPVRIKLNTLCVIS